MPAKRQLDAMSLPDALKAGFPNSKIIEKLEVMLCATKVRLDPRGGIADESPDTDSIAKALKFIADQAFGTPVRRVQIEDQGAINARDLLEASANSPGMRMALESLQRRGLVVEVEKVGAVAIEMDEGDG